MFTSCLLFLAWFLMKSTPSIQVLLHSIQHSCYATTSLAVRSYPATSAICRPAIHPASSVRNILGYSRQLSNMAKKEEAHQHQAGSSTDRDIDQWKHREPYRVHENTDDFDVKWEGQCHCGKVQYQLSRDKPLSAKYCHCTTCQRLHGVSCCRGYRLVNPGLTIV